MTGHQRHRCALRRDGGMPPRVPSRYRETDHYSDAFEDGMRFITRDMANEAIREGRDYPDEGGPGKMRRKKAFDGVDAVVVISKSDAVLITAWTEVNNWTGALGSDRWSLEQLRTIRAFEAREHKRPPGR